LDVASFPLAPTEIFSEAVSSPPLTSRTACDELFPTLTVDAVAVAESAILSVLTRGTAGELPLSPMLKTDAESLDPAPVTHAHAETLFPLLPTSNAVFTVSEAPFCTNSFGYTVASPLFA
jgi:hypothetical protein